MKAFEKLLQVQAKKWNVYSVNPCSFGNAKGRKDIHTYFNTKEEADLLAKEFNYSCTNTDFFKVEKTN